MTVEALTVVSRGGPDSETLSSETDCSTWHNNFRNNFRPSLMNISVIKRCRFRNPADTPTTLIEVLHGLSHWIFMFCWTCILAHLWVNDQLDAQLRYIKRFYYNPLHVWSNTLLIIRRSNCINTASGIVLSVSDRPVCRFSTCTSEYYTRCCNNTTRPPDDEHSVARNM